MTVIIAPRAADDMRRQTAVTAHFSSEQLLLFAFARQTAAAVERESVSKRGVPRPLTSPETSRNINILKINQPTS